MRTVFFILACIIGWCYGLALAGTEREARIKMLMQRHPNSIFLPMPTAYGDSVPVFPDTIMST